MNLSLPLFDLVTPDERAPLPLPLPPLPSRADAGIGVALPPGLAAGATGVADVAVDVAVDVAKVADVGDVGEGVGWAAGAAPASRLPAGAAAPPAAAPWAPVFDLALYPAVWRASQVGGVARPVTTSGFAALDAQLPGGGWPHGVLTELLLPEPGVGELRLLAPALAAVAAAYSS